MVQYIVADMVSQEGDQIGIKQVRSLSTGERERLAEANSCIWRVFRRVAFAVLAENYRTFVNLETSLVTRASSQQSVQQSEFPLLTSQLTTAIVNFLTSMRMFLDHAATDLKRRDDRDGGDRLTTWEAACSAEFDDYFAYRFLYKFRNYIQHVGPPLSRVVVNSGLGDEDEVVGSVFLGESPERLLKEYKEWAKLREEIEGLQTDIDLAEQIHVGMECLTRIATALLEEDVPDLAASVEVFKEYVGDFDSFEGTPILAQIEGGHSQMQLGMVILDIGQCKLAEQFVRAQSHND